MIEMFQPSRHLSSFLIAGFQHHDGALVFDQLKIGMPLKLVPERDNPYDPDAMAVTLNGTMLGYVPRDENGILSLMDYYGHADVFEVRILQVDKEAAPWQQVRVGVYIRDAR